MRSSTSQPKTPRAAARVRAAIDKRLDQTLFKALSDQNRLRVLACLIKCGRACSVSEVAECCDVDFSVVNRHMRILADAGVLEAEKRGRTVWYTARCDDLVARLGELIEAINEWCPNACPTSRSDTGSAGKGVKCGSCSTTGRPKTGRRKSAS